MENFEFYNPVHLVFGPGERHRTGELTASLGSRCLIVTYKDNTALEGALNEIRESLDKQSIKSELFSEVVANPTIETARKGVELAKRTGAEFIIGLGGGSAMDTAKIIAAGVSYEGDIWNMIVSRHDKEEAVAPTEALPTVMVPTLPATSSEMNAGAVLTNQETKVKSYVFAPCLYPRISILDPELTTGLPAYQTACGAADAISHVMEVYLNGADETPVADSLMEGIMRTLIDNTEKVLKDPGDIKARGQIQWAACAAWNGWTTPGTASTTPMHLVAHVLSGQFNITHGATLAIVMPPWMRHFTSDRPERYIQLGRNVLGMDSPQPDEVIDRFEKLISSWGIDTKLNEYGIGEDSIDPLTEEVVKRSFLGDGTLPARPKVERDDVKTIFQMSFR